MLVMTNARHKPSNDVPALLGSVSAPDVARAHYCDRNANDSAVTMQPSREIAERSVNEAVIQRQTASYPQNTRTLRIVTSNGAAVLPQSLPITPPRDPSEDDEDDEREDEDSDEDLDDHPEDFDARADYAARYNDYLRELEA